MIAVAITILRFDGGIVLTGWTLVLLTLVLLVLGAAGADSDAGETGSLGLAAAIIVASVIVTLVRA